ncbi:MAG: hypothetical protein J2P37_12825 [Ktedonobacteraceae bacterium]|nr:hypothetical protein [Ktedonobacteraceae bacterium]MBO0791270.1 hypothetical protein [Ktedonobacteraceae bacterium]
MLEKERRKQASEIKEEASLQNKPQWRPGKKISTLLLIAGLVVILGGISFTIWQVVVQQGTIGSSGNVSGTDGDKSAGNLPVPPAYWEVIQSEMAQGLHLSRTQVQGKLRTGTNNGANLSGSAPQPRIASPTESQR